MSDQIPVAIRVADGDPQELALPAGALLTEALADTGLALDQRCGGRGTCGSCRVHLADGVLHHHDGDDHHQGPIDLLGCRCRVPSDGNVSLQISHHNLLSGEAAAVTDFTVQRPDVLRPLAEQGTLGIAIDIGTTTVVGILIDLTDGRELRRASSFNAQMRLADDVLARIQRCLSDERGLAALERAIIAKTLTPLMHELLQDVDSDDLAAVTIAGNATMLHLLLGIDPSPMGTVPFTPAFLERRQTTLAELGLPGPEAVAVHLLPGAAAYVGADIVAGVVATGMDRSTDTVLLVDVGTNGEMVLQHQGRMTACATAAGPAFEGAGLMCGTRGQPGAISHMHLRQDPFSVIAEYIGSDEGHCPGICGSAFVDLLSEGVQSGLISPVGRLDPEHPATNKSNYGYELPIAAGQKVTDPDIAVLLQAKAAVAAGILTLLEREGLTPADVDRLYLAGGFGLHMNLTNAIGCGLLPGFTVDQIALVGNTSLGGAWLSLIDQQAGIAMDRLAPAIDVIELNQDPMFEMRYIDQLSL